MLRSSDGALTRTSHYLIDTAHAWPQVIARRSTDTNSAGQTLSSQITAWHGTTGATATPTGDSLVRQVRIDAATGQSPGPVIQADLLPLAGHLGTSLGAVDAAGQVQEAVATDAFGQLRIPGSHSNPGGATNAPAGGWQQSHLFAGEYWDQDAQLLYLRARWYDPQIGRFIGADPFEWRQTDPKSLNRYAYASSDPVQRTDPSGMMSLGEIGAGMDVQGILMNVAKDQAIGFLQDRIFGENDNVVGPPSLYEMLLAQLVSAYAGTIGGAEVSAAVMSRFVSGKTEDHHVIPEYMCGAKSQMDLVAISVPDHHLLHGRLGRFVTTVNIGARVIEVVFKKRKKLQFMSKVNELARTRGGRLAIATALETFYLSDGNGQTTWFETGRGKKTGAPIGVVLAAEAMHYVMSNHQYDKNVPCKK